MATVGSPLERPTSQLYGYGLAQDGSWLSCNGENVSFVLLSYHGSIHRLSVRRRKCVLNPLPLDDRSVTSVGATNPPTWPAHLIRLAPAFQLSGNAASNRRPSLQSSNRAKEGPNNPCLRVPRRRSGFAGTVSCHPSAATYTQPPPNGPVGVPLLLSHGFPQLSGSLLLMQITGSTPEI